MKARAFLVVLGLAGAALPAVSQGLVPVDAISRRVVFVVPEPSMKTDAASRRLAFTIAYHDTFTDANSRRLVVTNAFHDTFTDANSRQVTADLAAYGAPDVQTALRVAAGLVAASQGNVGRLNVIRDGASASSVDVRDAVRIARMAMGLDP